VIALVSAVRRRDLLILVPLTVIAAGLGFDLVAYLTGGIIWSYRYLIAVLPLEVVLVGVALAPAPLRDLKGVPRFTAMPNPRPSLRPSAFWARSGMPVVILTVVSLVLLGPSLPATAAGMFNPHVGYEESRTIGYVVHSKWSSVDRNFAQNFQKSQDIATFISGLRPPAGDVVVDNSSPCIPLAIVLSPDPRVWVIPNDRDFQRILADPLAFHTHYVLLPPPTGQGSLIATSRQYPALYSSGEDNTGQHFATLMHSFTAGGGACPSFRLYRVTQHTPVT